ncbi:hypothetical protein Taro_026849 [Colocasia esculenta]|uniref:Gem-associated protein 2 n=1 Tax=Colocasia esculenta TaxID=4460 RepID=A0A843VPU7_COLES|nr:hypothetical protein [Colocasia esculenta]
MLAEIREDMTKGRGYDMAEDAQPVEDFGARSVSCLETASKNGGVAGMMFDTSIACTRQSARVMTTNGAAENCNAVDGVYSNESPEVIEPKGKSSTWKSNQSSESLDVTKNECALNLVVSDFQTEDGKTGERLARRYTRSVLEALRFVDVDKQREKWDAIYKGLDSIASREYDEVLTSSQKKVNWNYDQQQRQEKKKGASTTRRELSVENFEKVSSAPEISALLCSSSVEEDSWAVEEGQCTEDESDDEYDSIQRPAFYVEGEPDFESGPPQDGWEYLRRVRWEAAQMPKVKVSKLDRTKWSTEQTPYMPKIPEIAKCPENLLPLKQWADIFLADFAELRKAFSEFENSADRAIYKPSDRDLCEDSRGLKRNIPSVSAILDMNCVSRAATLRNRIKAFESASVLSRDHCLWLFALCAAVDTPLNAEMGSCLRCLLRKCSTLLGGKSEFDEEVAMLNMLIVISGKYFGQSEN